VLAAARKRLSELEDLTYDMAESKPWINATFREDIQERISDTRRWLTEIADK
jgi:hypothetical protein